MITLAEIEKAAILLEWRRCNYDAVVASKALGIGKTTMYRKLKEYGIGPRAVHHIVTVQCDGAERQMLELKRAILEAEA